MSSEDMRTAKIAAVLRETNTVLFEYVINENYIIILDDDLNPKTTKPELLSYLEHNDLVAKEDRWKAIGFFAGTLQGPVEVNVSLSENQSRALNSPAGEARRVRISALRRPSEENGYVLEGCIRDVTEEKLREEELERRAQRDSLTGLYNHETGKELINDYLKARNPYEPCGFIVVDVDFFKNANDMFGHQFGDQVLVEMARMLQMMFRPDDVLIRMGGDEFAVLLKNIDHTVLMKKALQLVETTRKLEFPVNLYSITCSAGVCFLPENVSGYNFDNLFKNADWALYRAKENGRNRYEFCDYLRRFEMTPDDPGVSSDIDTRYLHGDIVSIAFEVFEKAGSFNEAIKRFLEIVGIRFKLDRITVIRTDIKEQESARQYQWVSDRAPEVLEAPGTFTKEDFITLFSSYDEYGTTVLHYDDMGAYSPGAASLLMQGGAKTVLYAAMYCEGSYTGAVSYVTCDAKRFWSRQDRAVVGELTKIISAHLAKSLALNASVKNTGVVPEYDSLTGLLSFHRFREEVERLIVGGHATAHAVVCSDLLGFDDVNREYGFSTGEMLLKRYSNKVAEAAEASNEVLFSRIVNDQFALFTPCDDADQIAHNIRELNGEFESTWKSRYPKSRLQVRAGVYMIGPDCTGASYAIDAATFARDQVGEDDPMPVRCYNEEIAQRRSLEDSLESQVDDALSNGRIQVYLQPRVRLSDGAVMGAEALVRWRQEDGTVMLPAEFLPLLERTGKVIDLDLFVLGQVATFLARCDANCVRPLSVSVNASILHTSDEETAERYRAVLEQHGLDPSRVQVEFTEAETVLSRGGASRLFGQLQSNGIQTALDDFGTSVSLLMGLVDAPVNTVKLGRQFIGRCLESENGILMIGRLVNMMKELGYGVACEGVETEEQANILRELGCEEAQGYFFSHPLPLDEFERFAYRDGKWDRTSS